MSHKFNLWKRVAKCVIVITLMFMAASTPAFASFSLTTPPSPPVVPLAVASAPAPSVNSATNIDAPDSTEKMTGNEMTTNDPLEDINRPIFEANDFLDRLLLRPLAELDRALIPPEIRDRISGILNNMREPVILTNNLLQGEFDQAGITAERFTINTTLGIGGMFDWASDWKLNQQKGDFGQTLYVWGIGSGPYLVLPLFGPSNLRDAVGIGVDTVISPWQYAVHTGGTDTYDTFEIVDFGVGGITKREQNIEVVDALRSGSLDFYAKVRSAYNQHRNSELGVEGILVTPVLIP